MLKDTLLNTIGEIWPMIAIFTIILSSVRIVYLFTNHERLTLWRELITLSFLIYILVLFYIVTSQDYSQIGTSNYIPFKEIFRYDFGSQLFFKNIVGNMLIFIPFGLFISYYINKHRILPIFFLTFISSASIEFVQSKIGRVFDVDDIILNVIGGLLGYLLFIIFDTIDNRLPKIFRTNIFRDIVIIIIILLLVWYLIDFNINFVRGLL